MYPKTHTRLARARMNGCVAVIRPKYRRTCNYRIKYRLHGRVVKGVGSCELDRVHGEAMETGGREVDPRPGHYSRARFCPTRQLVRFSQLNVSFFQILNLFGILSPRVSSKLKAICAFPV